MPQGDETPGVTTEGEGVPREYGRGWEWYGNPPTTRATEARGAGSRDEEMMGGPETAPPPRPQRGMAADNNSVGTLLRHNAGTYGARLKHGALVCRK